MRPFLPPCRRRSVFTFVLAAALAGCSNGSSSVASRSVNAADLPNPPEIVSTNGVARVVLQAVINPATGGPAVQYDGALVPPTIRVSPGDTIAVTYTNSLPPMSQEPLNATNLHFHGLATSPNPPADDAIDILAMPGQNAALRRPGDQNAAARFVLVPHARPRRSQLATVQRHVGSHRGQRHRFVRIANDRSAGTDHRAAQPARPSGIRRALDRAPRRRPPTPDTRGSWSVG